jgi:hypothetical protein
MNVGKGFGVLHPFGRKPSKFLKSTMVRLIVAAAEVVDCIASAHSVAFRFQLPSNLFVLDYLLPFNVFSTLTTVNEARRWIDSLKVMR